MSTATAPATEKEKKVETLQIEPASYYPSSYKIEGNDFPIDHSSMISIPSTDRLVLKNDVWFGNGVVNEKAILGEKEEKPKDYFIIGRAGDLVKIQYIRGYGEIYTALQEYQNQIPEDKHLRGEQKKNSLIIMNDGFLEVKKEGLGVGLFKYLKKCNYNETNPDRDATIARILFREKNNDRALQPGLDFQDIQKEAIDLLYMVREKGTNNIDEEKLDYYCTLFEIPGNLTSPIQKWSVLLKTAKEKPKQFLDAINSDVANYVTVIIPAFDHNLLFMDDKSVYDENKNLLATSDKKINKEWAIDKLIKFYSTPKGAVKFEGLKNKLSVAQRDKETPLS